MILFSFSFYNYLAKPLLKNVSLKEGQFEIKRFSNQEMQIILKTKVKNETCVILGSTMPPDSNILSLSLLAHTLKKEGARQIIALIPYLAYSRHDKIEPKKSLATQWLGNLLKASGINKIVTVDLHSPEDKQLFNLPIVSLPFFPLFASVLKKFKKKKISLVAPDHGALDNCEEFKKVFKNTGSIAYFKKQRTASGITLSHLFGKINRTAFLIDDMLDTGGTLIQAAQKLKEAGTKELYVIVTHGIFTGNKWKQLWRLGVKNIYCTDSIPSSLNVKDKRIIKASCLPVIKKNF